MKDAGVFLRHIRDAITRVGAYTAAGRRAFLADTMVQDAVIRNLKVIGEAVRTLPLDLRRQHPQIPWRSITALRNVLIHEYFGVDIEIVWRVVERRLPTLMHHVDLMLKKSPRAR